MSSFYTFYPRAILPKGGLDDVYSSKPFLRIIDQCVSPFFFLSTMYIFALWFVPYVVFFLCACCCSNFFLLPNWINFFSLVTLDAVRICARVFFFCFFFVFFWEERWMCSLIKDFVSYWRGTRVYTAARRETVRYWSASERLEGQRWQRDRFF